MQPDLLDEALETLERFGPEYGGGMASHGPMACEALHALGRDEAILPWLVRYSRRLEAWPAPIGRIERGNWREALGKSARSSDWRAFFAEELREASWREVLARWLPELAPGLSGAAAHGLIRTAHATRAIAERESAPRTNELAAALAYWASVHERLLDRPGPNAGLGVAEALERVELLPEAQRVGGFISDRLARLSELPSSAGVADLVDLEDEARTLSALTRTFARVYCANAARRPVLVALLHSVTAASALRPLWPHADPRTRRALLRYAWQFDAALYATHADPHAPSVAIEPFATPEELVEAAIRNGDEHAIKLAEVALRESAIAPDTAYLQAAAHWARGGRA